MGDKKRRHKIEQWEFLERVRANGGIAFFADSVDAVVEGLKEA